MKPRFFVDLPDPSGDAVPPGLLVELSDADARHARTVLRSRPDDPCELVFSRPSVLADGVFAEVGRRVTVRVVAAQPLVRQRVMLLLAQALPQPRKVDEVIEKGTEVGFDSFLVLPASGSPAVPVAKVEGRLSRWRAIAGEAAKQSRQPAVPEVRTSESLEAAIGLVRAEGWTSVVLTPDAEAHLGDVLAAAAREAHVSRRPARWALWVGPEGGWSREEREGLVAAGARPAGLGFRVLRTETAGPVSGALARYALSDW